METALFEIQADHLRAFRHARLNRNTSQEIFRAKLQQAEVGGFERDPAVPAVANATYAAPNSASKPVEPATGSTADLASCFLRLANLPNYALDRLSRYEATLWRQVAQILFALDHLDRRKPQDRRSHFRNGRRQEPLSRMDDQW